jgi:hypothetical protein
MAHQSPGEEQEGASTCSSALPRLTGDSLGPIKIGMTVGQFQRRCPHAAYFWDLGDEAVETPGAIILLGGARVVVNFSDTLAASTLTSLTSRSPILRTVDGIRVGSTLASMSRIWGAPRGAEAECVPFAWFDRAPGLSFRLDPGEGWDCGDLGDNEKAIPQALLDNATVKEVIVLRSHR